MAEREPAEEKQADMLRRIAAQDRAAFGEFYDQAAGALFSFAVRVLGDPHEAEEVIQDVFLQIWNKAATFDPVIGQPLHWAMSITRNRCIDRLRSRQRRSQVLVEMDQGSEPDPPADVSPSGPPLAASEMGAVRSAVAALPGEQRRAIEMAFFGGLTHHEIAEALHEPLGTVKARIRRGMLKLRESLQTYV